MVDNLGLSNIKIFKQDIQTKTICEMTYLSRDNLGTIKQN